MVSLHLLVLVTPFAFTWVNEELFEFNKMMVTYALATLIAGGWVARMILTRKMIWHKTALDIPLALFVASQVLSTLFSIHPRTSWLGYYTRFHGGLLSTVTYVVVYYAAVNTVRKKQLSGLLLSTLVASIFASLYAIPEHFGHSPSCWLITSGQSFGVDCWIQDVKSRIFGTFGQPNWLAAYAITLLPLSLVWSWLVPAPKKNTPTWLPFLQKSVGPVAALLLTMSLLFTQSRSGLLGLIVGLGVFLLGWCYVLYQELNTQKATSDSSVLLPRLQWLGVGVLAMVIPIIIWGTPYTPSLQTLTQKWQSPQEVANTPTPEAGSVNRLDVGGTDSGEIRRIVWEGAVGVWKRYPVFGSGVETFAYSYYQDRPVAHNLVSEWDFLYNKAHNEFLNFLATTGIVGLASYCILLLAISLLCVSVLVKKQSDLGGVPAPQRQHSEQLLALATLSGIAALSVSNFFGFSTVMVTILLYLLPAAVIISTKPLVVATAATTKSESKTAAARSIRWDWIPLTLVALLVALALNQVRLWWSADAHFIQAKNSIRMGAVMPALTSFEKAIQESPDEALFYDEVAATYGQIALALGQQEDSTNSAQFTKIAAQYSDAAIKLNNRNLNFYRTRARLFINLAQLDPNYLAEAQHSLETAIELAPTDAKLFYNLSLVKIARGQTTDGISDLKHTIAIKDNYEAARFELGKQYQALGDNNQALEQYRYILTKINPGNEGVKTQLEALEASLSGTPIRN